MEKNKDNQQSTFYKDRGHFYLVNVLVDLFIAGMETTASTLNWSFLLLLHHPEIRRNIQKEIDEVGNILINHNYLTFLSNDRPFYIPIWFIEPLIIPLTGNWRN